jgi:hypothetical protein
MFNLYCYEQEKPGNWLLRAYVPVNAHYYTNSPDYYTNAPESELTFRSDDGYLKVFFRKEVIFTVTSKGKP